MVHIQEHVQGLGNDHRVFEFIAIARTIRVLGKPMTIGLTLSHQKVGHRPQGDGLFRWRINVYH